MIYDARTYASQTVRALALVLNSTAQRLSLPAAVTFAVRGQAYVLSAILAPGIRTIGDAANAGEIISAAIATMCEQAPSADAIQPLYDAAAACVYAAPSFASPARTRAASLSRTMAACAEATFLGQAFVAQASIDYGDRQAAVVARKRIADAMDASIDRIAQETALPVVDILSQTARLATGHIADVAANLQPIVRVQTPRSAPSTALAFRLYGDPSRAPELVARNRVATPIFMPTTIDALAPGA